MLLYSEAEFEIDYNRRHNIKSDRQKTKQNTREFSKIAYITITVAAFAIMIFISIKLLS